MQNKLNPEQISQNEKDYNSLQERTDYYTNFFSNQEKYDGSLSGIELTIRKQERIYDLTYQRRNNKLIGENGDFTFEQYNKIIDSLKTDLASLSNKDRIYFLDNTNFFGCNFAKDTNGESWSRERMTVQYIFIKA